MVLSILRKVSFGITLIIVKNKRLIVCFISYLSCFSLVQHECIPQAVLGMDILCQAKSGMGKTAVFVLATLQQLEPTENVVYVLVMCHTRELAFQISKEYERFSKYMPSVKVSYYFVSFKYKKKPFCHIYNYPITKRLVCRYNKSVVVAFYAGNFLVYL